MTKQDEEIDFFNPFINFPNEEWAVIDFADRHYEISNYGRLKSFVYLDSGEILKNRNFEGYFIAEMSVSGKRKRYFLHKLVAQYFVKKDDENKKVVIHLDNNKRNNYYKNLKWATKKECFEHTEIFNEKMSTHFRSKKLSNAKITEDDVKVIRKMIKEGIPQVQIAKKYNISQMQITRIKRNENWVVKKERKIVYHQKVLPKK